MSSQICLSRCRAAGSRRLGAAKSYVRRTCVRRRPAPRAGPVALAIIDAAEKGPAFGDALGGVGIAGVEALLRSLGIFAKALARQLDMGVRPVPVAGPLPDIAGHVVEAVAVGRKGLHRRGAGKAVLRGVLHR